MSELDNLLSKSDSDLAAIAVAYGDFTAEEVGNKTREELIAAITKQPQNSSDDSLTEAKAVAPKQSTIEHSQTTKKRATKPVSKKKASVEVDVIPSILFEEKIGGKDTDPQTLKAIKKAVKQKADAVQKKPRGRAKVKAADNNQIDIETVAQNAPSSEAAAEAKTEEIITTNVIVNNDADSTTAVEEKVTADATAVEASVENSAKQKKPIKGERKPSAKSSGKTPGRKKKVSADGDKSNAEVKDIEVTNDEGKTEEKIAEENSDVAAVTPETAKEVGKKEFIANNNRRQKPQGRVKVRTHSFGPDQATTVVSVEEKKALDEANANAEVNSLAEEVKAEAEKAPVKAPEPEIVYAEVVGILSIGTGSDKGDFCGFLHKNNYLPGEDDVYVPGQMIRRFGLRKGDKIKGLVPAIKGRDKFAPLRKILEVNERPFDESNLDATRKRKRFENLTAIYPDEKLVLETEKEDISTRMIDLFSPIGKGQRGMIVSPPKAGKTILLKKIANAITTNSPNSKLLVLLIDERPEEVTDMQRSINGEVVYSTFDRRPENHVKVTELVLERAMRLVEIGEDVVILLDSMTRLARAYNLTITPTGRTLSGGLDPGSLYGPKRFFGAARNIENGGSLTIIATALVETGSRMDEVIFEEFKGTGNMEVTLDRKLADKRVFPAIAVEKSGTRREDLLLTPKELDAIWLFRKQISDVDTTVATEAVINFMKKTNSNSHFIESVRQSYTPNK